MPMGGSLGGYPERLSRAASGEVMAQMQRGVGPSANGAANFITGPKSITQWYLPSRVKIGAGRGANTAGAVAGTGTIARTFREKNPKVRLPGRQYYATARTPPRA